MSDRETVNFFFALAIAKCALESNELALLESLGCSFDNYLLWVLVDICHIAHESPSREMVQRDPELIVIAVFRAHGSPVAKSLPTTNNSKTP